MELQTPLRRLTVREQVILSILWLALNVLTAALLPVVIPTQILLFVAPGQVGNAQQAELLGWLSTLGAIMSLFIPPLVGMLSDHTSSIFGRRRPYIAVGTLCMVLCTPLLIQGTSVALFILGLAILQVGANILTAAYQSLVPDMVPKEQRGEASGYVGLMTILGNVISLGLAAWLFSQVAIGHTGRVLIEHSAFLFYSIAVTILLIGTLITLFGVHETPYALSLTVSAQAEAQVRQRFRQWVQRNWLDPWREYNFTLVFLTRFSVMMGLALFMTFIEYYFANVSQSSHFVQTTVSLAVLSLLGAVVSAFGLGILSDHVRRAPIVSLATACMSLASLAFVISPNHVPLWPLGILFGLGYGAYSSVDWALSIDALPSMNAVGKDMGLWSASATLPGILAPLLGSLLISLASTRGQTALGYRLTFALATFFLLIAAVTILLVRERHEVRDAYTTSPTGTMEMTGRTDKTEKIEGTERAERPWRGSRATLAVAPTISVQGRGNPRGRPGGVPAVHGGPGAHVRRSPHVNWLWRLALQTRAGEARGVMRFWPFWERLMHRLWHIQAIPNAPHHLFEVRFTRYHGRAQTVADGLRIAPGDPVVELHFSNRALMQAAGSVSNWRLLHMMREDLQALAQWAQQTDFPSEARFIRGVTLLGRGAPRLGFIVRERPHNLAAWCDRIFMMGLLVLYHRAGRARLTQGSTYNTYPQEVWMTREELIRRYGNHKSV